MSSDKKRQGSSSSLSEMFSDATKQFRRGSRELPHHKKLKKDEGHRLRHSPSGSQFSKELFNRTEARFTEFKDKIRSANEEKRKNVKWLDKIKKYLHLDDKSKKQREDIKLSDKLKQDFHLHEESVIGVSDNELIKLNPDKDHHVMEKIRAQIESNVRNAMVGKTMYAHDKKEDHSHELAHHDKVTTQQREHDYVYQEKPDIVEHTHSHNSPYAEVANPYETSLQGTHTNYEGKKVDPAYEEVSHADNIYEDPDKVRDVPGFRPEEKESIYATIDGPKKRLDGGDELGASSSTDVEPEYMQVESVRKRNRAEYEQEQQNLYEEIGPAKSSKGAPPLPPGHPKMIQNALENPAEVKPPQSTSSAPPRKRHNRGKEAGR